MDPLTRGSLFHAMQTAFYRRLQREGALPVTPEGRDARARRARRGREGGCRSRIRGAVARRSIASGTTRLPSSGATCGCGWTKSRAPAANGSRRGSSGRSATRTAERWPWAAIRRAVPEPVVHRRPIPPPRLDRSGRGARGHRRAARDRSQDGEVPRQGPHDRRRRRGAAAGAVLARARAGDWAVRSSKAASTTRRPPAGIATSRIPLTPQARRLGRRGARDHRPRDRDRLPRRRRRPNEGLHVVRLRVRVRTDRRASHPTVKAQEPLADLLELRRKP